MECPHPIALTRLDAALLPGVLAGSPTIALAWLTVALGGLELTVAVSWAICLDIGGEYSGSSSLIQSSAQLYRSMPSLSAQLMLANGAFRFIFTDTSANGSTVMAATSLTVPFSNWTPLGQPASLGSGVYQFTDTAATNFTRRFYRLRSP